MMIRENLQQEEFRGRKIKVGSQIVLSPWHIQRHERLWDKPDVFNPDRWQTDATKQSSRKAYMPFSSGQRVCTGAGFAMIEGVVMIAMLLRAFHLAPTGKAPVPVAHLTVRAEEGIHLTLTPRGSDTTSEQTPE
jgi:cytochrome P450